MKRRKLYYLEQLADPYTGGWRQDFLRSGEDLTNEVHLIDALLEREPEPDAHELARAYSGHWIVWSGKRQGVREAVLALVRSQLDVGSLVFLKDPTSEDLDTLHEQVAASIMRAVVPGELPSSLRETVELQGDKPLARIHLSQQAILDRAQQSGRIEPPAPKPEPAQPKRRLSGWGALYRSVGANGGGGG